MINLKYLTVMGMVILDGAEVEEFFSSRCHYEKIRSAKPKGNL